MKIQEVFGQKEEDSRWSINKHEISKSLSDK